MRVFHPRPPPFENLSQFQFIDLLFFTPPLTHVIFLSVYEVKQIYRFEYRSRSCFSRRVEGEILIGKIYYARLVILNNTRFFGIS